MKHTILYLLATLSICITACVKTPKVITASQIQGTYTGQFVEIIPGGAKGDTLTAAIQINLDASDAFSVTGDTSTVHAGSHGRFVINSSNTIDFFDATFSSTGTTTKTHLSGEYQYTFSNNVYLDIIGSSTTGVSYTYTLQKQ